MTKYVNFRKVCSSWTRRQVFDMMQDKVHEDDRFKIIESVILHEEKLTETSCKTIRDSETGNYYKVIIRLTDIGKDDLYVEVAWHKAVQVYKRIINGKTRYLTKDQLENLKIEVG